MFFCNYADKGAGLLNKNKDAAYKSVLEISSLASQLTPSNQSYVLNTINALLFSQQVNEEQKNQSHIAENKIG